MPLNDGPQCLNKPKRDAEHAYICEATITAKITSPGPPEAMRALRYSALSAVSVSGLVIGSPFAFQALSDKPQPSYKGANIACAYQQFWDNLERAEVAMHRTYITIICFSDYLGRKL